MKVATPSQLTATEIEDQIQTGRAVLYYRTDWSGPCKHADSIVAAKYSTPIITVNIDRSDDWMKGRSIPGVPYFEYYEKGERIKDMIGVQSIGILRDFIEDCEVRYAGCSDFGDGGP